MSGHNGPTQSIHKINNHLELKLVFTNSLCCDKHYAKQIRNLTHFFSTEMLDP